jgi:hypothetical protein
MASPAQREQGELSVSGIRRLVTEEEFNACLRAERVPWSCYARDAEAVVASWAESDRPPAEVIRVEPDEQPFVVRWLTEQGKEQLATTGSGGVGWVKSGVLVADLMSPLRSGPEEQVAYGDRRLEQPHRAAGDAGLAAALEATGCRNAEVLSHLSDAGLHVRGCWAVDAVLGRE